MAETTVTRRATVSCPFCTTLNRVDLARVDDRPRCGECGRPILLDRPLKVSDTTFERVVAETDVPVVVDFYADWCGPCKIMAPILDDLARTHAGEVLVTKLDTDGNPAMVGRFGIRAIPTLVIFWKGREAARQAGAIPRPELEALVDSVRRP